MSNAEIITKALERSIRTITRQPSAGQGTGNMRIDVAPDGCCTAVDGDTSMVIDMSQIWGGQGTTPGPGFYLRAALGACLAQSYHIYAISHGVAFDEISVEIEDEYDMRGNLGIDKSIPPGYVAVRYAVNIRSSAPEEKIREVIDYADALDFVRDIFARAVPMERVVNIPRPEGTA